MVTVYAATRSGLLVAGEDRTFERRLGDVGAECVAASPAAPERVVVGTFDDGLFLSTDGGSSFEAVAPDTPDRVTAVASSPHDSDVFWAGTEPSRVFRSSDGGTTWHERPGVADLPSAEEWYFPPRPHTHHVRWIEPDPADPDRLYVGIEAGALVRTTDGGRTWQDRPAGARQDNHSLATHPDAPGRVYSAAGDGYAESTDGGDEWSYPQEKLAQRYCWSIAVDPADPDVRMLSSATGPGKAHSQPGESYVYRRTGEGPWERAMDGLPGPDGLLRAELEPVGPGEFLALTNHGLFRSADAGGSWESYVDLPEAYRDQAPRGLVAV